MSLVVGQVRVNRAQSWVVTHNDEGIPDPIDRLWSAVQAALRACGDPSPREIDRLAASCGLRLPSSTVEGWFKTWSVVPAWDKFDVLIKALGAEHDQDWRFLHGRAQLADRQRKAVARQQTYAEVAPPPQPPTPGARDQRRGRHVTAEVTRLPEIRARVTHALDHKSVVLLAAGAFVVLVLLAVSLNALDPGRSRDSLAGAHAEPASDRSASAAPAPTQPTTPPTLPPGRLPRKSELRDPPPAQTGAPRVLYLGDQFATETLAMVTFFVHRSGRGRVVPADQPGTAPCDHLGGYAGGTPAAQELPVLVEKVRPHAIVLQFSGVSTPCIAGAGDDAPGTKNYYWRYLRAAMDTELQITKAARSAGIKRPKLIWVLQAPHRTHPDRTRMLDKIFKEVAANHEDLVVDAGWHVSGAANPLDPGSRYRWQGFLPCTSDEHRDKYCTHPEAFGGVTRLRNESDSRRLCLDPPTTPTRPCRSRSPGVARYGKAIAHSVISYLRDHQ